MTLESVEVMKAEDLPLKVRQESGIFSGFVEIRYERSSPLKSIVAPIKGTFSQRLRGLMKSEGSVGKVCF